MDDSFADEKPARKPDSSSSILTYRSMMLAGLLLIAMLGWVYYISRVVYADSVTISSDSMRAYTGCGLAIASVLSPLGAYWLWLRTHIRSRYLRITVGWVLCHVMIGIFTYVTLPSRDFTGEWNRILTFCLALSVLFVIQGIFFELWIRVLRLSTLMVSSYRGSRLSIVDLFSLTSLCALMVFELAWIERGLGGFDFRFTVPALLIGALMVLLGALMVMLGYGFCFGRARYRFAISFLAVLILSPVLGVWSFQYFGAFPERGYYVQVSVLTAAYLIETVCVFPLIWPSSPAVPCRSSAVPAAAI